MVGKDCIRLWGGSDFAVSVVHGSPNSVAESMVHGSPNSVADEARTIMLLMIVVFRVKIRVKLLRVVVFRVQMRVVVFKV